MFRRTILGLALGSLLAATVWVPASPGAPDVQFDAISRLIEKADLALEEGNREEAVQLYGATLNAYQDFIERFPEYLTDLVRFRVSYCRQQLAFLRAANPDHEIPDVPLGTHGIPLTDRLAAAIEQCRHGRFEAAGSIVDAILDEHPDHVLALLLKATTEMAAGRFADAKGLLERVVSLDSGLSRGMAHYNMAQLLMRDGEPDYEAVRRHYRLALEFGAVADSDLEGVLGE